jgi:uncharacterized protein (TIGR03643 family)
MKNIDLTNDEKYRLIEMAWQDRTTFDVMEEKFDLNENQIKNLMRELISPKAYKRWRKRVQGRVTKHKKRVKFKPIRFQGPW